MAQSLTVKIGRYEIIKELGRGGMAVVYLARDPKFKRQVAIKVLPHQLTFAPQFRARFDREAEVIASLEHDAIVPVYDYSEDDGQPYLVMRYMPGGSLRERIQRKRLTLTETQQIVRRIAPALQKAHRRGVIHRDLKPENILFDSDGEPAISDFGIAKLAESSQALSGSLILGTLAYMSPEQARGNTKLDGRSDQYSLAVMIYEMLTRKTLFKANTPIGLVHAHVSETPPSILKLRKDLPKEFGAVLDKALSKSAKNRYRNVQVFEREFSKAVLNRPPKKTDPPAPFVREGAGKQKPAPPTRPISNELSQKEQKKVESRPSFWKRIKPIFWDGIHRIDNSLKRLIFRISRGLSFLRKSLIKQRFAWVRELPTLNVYHKIVIGVLAFISSFFVLSFVYAPQYLIDPRGHEMVLVPSGPFSMGSLNGGSDELPVHEVFLSAYYLDVYEVTNIQFSVFLNDVPSQVLYSKFNGTLINEYEGIWRVEPGFESYPVVDVTWFNAQAFCEWRNAGLPSEAQWEKGARGTDDRPFPWGRAVAGIFADFNRTSGPSPVGSFPRGASPYGNHDMAGNVWEWTRDWYDDSYYSGSPYVNPLGPDNGVLKVRRGGSTGDNEDTIRSSLRNSMPPNYSDSVIGFRCARQSDPSTLLYGLLAIFQK